MNIEDINVKVSNLESENYDLKKEVERLREVIKDRKSHWETGWAEYRKLREDILLGKDLVEEAMR